MKNLITVIRLLFFTSCNDDEVDSVCGTQFQMGGIGSKANFPLYFNTQNS